MKSPAFWISIFYLFFLLTSCSGINTGNYSETPDDQEDQDNDFQESDNTVTDDTALVEEDIDETQDLSDADIINPVCGNNEIEENEVCDGGTSLCSLLSYNYSEGMATCKNDCTGWDLSNCVKKEGTCEGDFYIKTEADLDSISECTGILGNIYFDGDELENIELPYLVEVSGNFIIGRYWNKETSKWEGNGCTNLISVSIQHLTKVGGEFWISDNPALTTITFTEIRNTGSFMICWNDILKSMKTDKLFSVDGDFWIWYNKALLTASFPILNNIPGDVFFGGNTELMNFYFPELTTAGGNFTVAQNQNLQKFEVPELKTTAHTFWIKNNNSLSSFSVPSLQNIGKDLEVCDNPRLQQILFSSLNKIDGELYVASNQKIETISMPLLKTIKKGLGIYSNKNLRSLFTKNLETVEVSFVISGNDLLEIISLTNLTTAWDRFEIGYNDSVETIDLPNLRTVNGEFRIWDNRLLQSFSAQNLKTAQRVVINGENLRSANLNSLESIERDFYLSYSKSITDIYLPSIKTIGNDLSITGCSALRSFNTPRLKIISGSLLIGGRYYSDSWEAHGNNSLSSFNLSSLEKIEENFVFMDNPELPETQIQDLLTQLNNHDGVGEEVVIEGNKE